MNNYTFSVDEFELLKGTHTIVINNIRYHSNYLKMLKKIIHSFFNKCELFFGFYRVDGLNLSFEQQKNLKNEIPIYFNKYGEFIYQNEYLSVAKLIVRETNFDFISNVFDYYLETIFFESKVSLDVFKQFHSEYLQHRCEDYILYGLTDFLLGYVDSGDLLLCFNTEKNSSIEVRRILDEIIFEKSRDGFLS